MPKQEPCPNCGRPIGFEYVAVEEGKCQLWRCFNEDNHRAPSLASVADCFMVTAKRIRGLTTQLVETEKAKQAAQRALSRHHAREAVASDPFPDNARIE